MVFSIAIYTRMAGASMWEPEAILSFTGPTHTVKVVILDAAATPPVRKDRRM
jgi:hypothetical protein